MVPARSFILFVMALLPGVAWGGLDCPVGTIEDKRQTAATTFSWCAFPDGTRHGPSIRVDASGLILEEGEWSMGLRQGQWKRYALTGERITSGVYEQGERVGTWTNFDPDTGWSVTRSFEDLLPPLNPLRPVSGDGAVWWSLDLPDTPTSLVPVGETLLVYTSEALIGVALDTGEPLFEIPLPAPPMSDLSIDDTRVAFVTEDGIVTVSDLDTNTMLKVSPSIPFTGIIALDGSVMVVRDRSGAVSAVDIDLGRRLWVSKGPWGRVGPVFSAGMLAGVQDRYVHQIDTVTGLRGSSMVLDGRLVELVPGYDGEFLFALDKEGGLYGLKLDTGEIIWRNDSAVHLKVRRGALLRDDQEGLLVFNGTEIIRIDHDTGVQLDRIEIDSDDVGMVDILDRLLCTQSPGQGLECGDIQGHYAWALDLNAAELSPLVMDRMVLSLEEGDQLLAIDRLGARVAGGLNSEIELQYGEVELVLDPAWVGQALDGAWVGEREWVNWLEVSDDTDECVEREIFLDLIALGGEDAVGREALLLDVELESWELDSMLESAESWTLENYTESWAIDLVATWSPQILGLYPFQEMEEQGTLEAALFQCELEELQFQGGVELQDGTVRRRFDGAIQLNRVPDLDSSQGCLLELLAGDEELGVWSTPLEEGRVWLRLLGHGEPPLASVEDLVHEGSLDGQLDGVDELEIWFSDSGNPWVEADLHSQQISWGPQGLTLRGSDSLVEVPLMISELSWPAAEEQGAQRWNFDALSILPEPNAQGLVPVIRVSHCPTDEDGQ